MNNCGSFGLIKHKQSIRFSVRLPCNTLCGCSTYRMTLMQLLSKRQCLLRFNFSYGVATVTFGDAIGDA
ncbi:hypothetical protein SAMN02982919_03226 [Giesbergeria anulus]|uniref:Uncharacterized protein n=1 Tax=Giesbergeria anulus TaxID=180197 RepID=A0A1H9SVL3_9BURK|nr:hypothetical protein SAMN02982919_03226 [Giesbergeria anulus]